MKFCVFKVADIQKYLTDDEKIILEHISERIEAGRVKDGKTPGNKYVLCNQDEPYAEKVWQVIEEGETQKHQEKMAQDILKKTEKYREPGAPRSFFNP